MLLYADDIVLLSESEDGVGVLMAAVHDYSVQWRFEINHAKCGLMCFRWAGVDYRQAEYASVISQSSGSSSYTFSA